MNYAQIAMDRVKLLLYEKKSLYDDINRISVYRNHRLNLRPWDRKLPPVVEQEANRRQLWALIPPTGLQIFGVLLLCLLSFQVVGILPFAVNRVHIEDTWQNMDKPMIVYHDAKVLLACWIVIHVCNGFAMWFIWLTEGFSKHQSEMLFFGISIFLECTWMDIIFFTHHLDWAMACWVLIFLSTLATQVLMFRNHVEIGALFLIPYAAGCIVVMVYIQAFIDKFGGEFALLI